MFRCVLRHSFALIVPAFLIGPGVAARAAEPLARAAELQAKASALVTPTSDTYDLTVDDAVRRALEQNLDIRVARLNPQIVDFNEASVRALYGPVFTSTNTYRNATNLPTSRTTQGTQTNQNFNFGQTQLLPWGGSSYSLQWNNTKLASANPFALVSPSYTSILLATFTQPLTKNFRIDTNRQQIEIIKLNRQISDTQLRGVITNTVANVRNAYWDLVYAGQNLAVQRQTLGLAQQLLNDNKVRVEVGTMAPIDVVQAEAEVAIDQQLVTVAEGTLETAQLALKRLIVDARDSELWNKTLHPTDSPQIEVRHPDVEAAIRNALAKRTDLEQLRFQETQSSVNQTYYANQRLPEINLIGTYQAAGIGGNQLATSNLPAGTISPGYSAALQTLSKLLYPTWTAQVNVIYPIGRNVNDALYARARLQAEQTRAQLKAAELQVATDVTQAALNVENALKQIEATRASRELSEKRLEAEQSKFEVGMSTNFFVVQAQRDLAAARNSELLAVLNYRKALVDFDRVQDTTLQRAGVSISTSGSTSGSGSSGGSSSSSGGTSP